MEKKLNSDCLFCKMIKGEINAEKVYEDELVFAFKDISPKAKVHDVIIPKKHIKDFESVNSEDAEYILGLHKGIQTVASVEGIKEDGYRVVVNNGENAGQTVFHLHYHLLGGEELTFE